MEPQQQQSCHLVLGDICPDFQAESNMGKVSLYHQMGQNNFLILFSHPKAKTPICTSELVRLSKLIPEFDKRNCKVVAMSCDDIETQKEWIKDIQDVSGCQFNFPLVSDSNRKIAKSYGMISTGGSGVSGGFGGGQQQQQQQQQLHQQVGGGSGVSGGLGGSNILTVRNVFFIGPDKRLRASINYPSFIGRNFDEVLRVLDSLLLNEKYKVATPANWNVGEDVFIDETVNESEAKKMFGEGWKVCNNKQYLRTVPQPKQIY